MTDKKRIEDLMDFEGKRKIDTARKLLIKYGKEKPEVAPIRVAVDPVSHGGGVKINQTKREPVTLPKFSGVEKDGQAFL